MKNIGKILLAIVAGILTVGVIWWMINHLHPIISGLIFIALGGSTALVLWSENKKKALRRSGVTVATPAPTAPTPVPASAPTNPVAPTATAVPAPAVVTTPTSATAPTNSSSGAVVEPVGNLEKFWAWVKDTVTKFFKIVLTIATYAGVIWASKYAYSQIPQNLETLYKVALIALIVLIAMKVIIKATERIDWVPTISPIALSVIWAAILLLIERYAVEYLVIKAKEFEMEKLVDLIPTNIVIEIFIGALFSYAWFKMWRTKPTEGDKKDDKSKGKDSAADKKDLLFEVPDGNKAILQILGQPIKFFVLGEGKLCLPPFCEATPVDMRKRTFQIPATKEEDGIILTTLDRQQVYVRISFTVKIGSVYTALFVVGPGAADDGMRNAAIQAARRGAALCTMEQILDANSEERKNMEDSLRGSVKSGAYDLGLVVDPKSLTVSKAVPVNPKVTEALEALVVQRNTNQAKAERSQAVQDMTKKIYESYFGGKPPAQHDQQMWIKAMEQANLRMDLSTEQTIRTVAPVSLLMNQTAPVAPTPPPASPKKNKP